MDPLEAAVASATLIVLGDDLEPDFVTRALGMFPDQAWRRGERPTTKTSSGRLIAHPAVAEWGGWKRFLPEALKGELLEIQLQHWVETLAANVDRIRELLTTGHTVTIDVYFSASEPKLIELKAHLLLALGQLGVDVDLHVYPHG
jgi:hypothetical protein